jgi:uncharacterized PurR-regulated membrane protein YhhQ (DUF165 family)
MTKYGEEDLDLLPDPGFRMPVQGLRKRSPVVAFLSACFRLVVPVAALVGAFVLVRYADGFPVTVLDRFPPEEARRNLSAWLSFGQFAIPLTFFVIHLTNRAYGAAAAFGQVLFVWAAFAAATVYLSSRIAEVLPWWRALPEAEAVPLAAALFAGHVTAIAVFDLTRGPNWWKAPLYGGLFGSAVYVGLVHTLTPPDPAIPVSSTFAVEGAINAAMAVLLLLPYWLLRPVIRPLPGYGGA